MSGSAASPQGRSELLRSELRRVCDELLVATGADRTTVRLDLPAHELEVDLTAAEALQPDFRSIAQDSSIDQRGLETIRWLEQHREPLVQSDFRLPPFPPSALVDVYGVEAQMLGPVEIDATLVGWVSVHSRRERPWSARDVAALGRTCLQVVGLIGFAGSAA